MSANKRKLAFLVFLLACLAGFGLWWLESRGKVSTDDAYIDGDIYLVTPRIDGYAEKVLVEDNQPVEAGQLLVAIDPLPFEVAVSQARAELAQAEATLAGLTLAVPLERTQTGFKVAEAEAELAKLMKDRDKARNDAEAALKSQSSIAADLRQAGIDFDRMQKLFQKGAVSADEYDKAETKVRTLEADLARSMALVRGAGNAQAAAEKDLDTTRAQIKLAATGSGTADIKDRQAAAQAAMVELARAKLHQAELDLTYTQIAAPVTGYVTRKAVTAGQMVSSGQRLMAVVPLDPKDLWVTANFKETQLTRIAPGQEVTIKVDTFPGHPLKGRVESVMSGTGAVFSLFPPENAAGNFVKVVQRVPVRIRFEAVDGAPLPPLKLGMSVVPTVLVGEE